MHVFTIMAADRGGGQKMVADDEDQQTAGDDKSKGEDGLMREKVNLHCSPC